VEAALVNTLSPATPVLMAAPDIRRLVARHGARLGLRWTSAGRLAPRRRPRRDRLGLARESQPRDQGVAVVPTRRRTGVTSRIAEVRRRIPGGHPALLMVDTISRLGTPTIARRVGVDVASAVLRKACAAAGPRSMRSVATIAASTTAVWPRAYWAGRRSQGSDVRRAFPYTPATNLCTACAKPSRCCSTRTAAVFARHCGSEGDAAAVRALGPRVLCLNPDEYSSSVTAVLMPDGHDATPFRRSSSIGSTCPWDGARKVEGRALRIGISATSTI